MECGAALPATGLPSEKPRFARPSAYNCGSAVRTSPCTGSSMIQPIVKLAKWALIPALLLTSAFSCLAASYEGLIAFVVCMAAQILAWRAVWLRQYYWAAGFAAAFVAFSPLFLVVKVFLLMGFACTVVLMALLAAFRTQPLPAEIP